MTARSLDTTNGTTTAAVISLKLSTMGRAAAEHAARGLHVFPCGKSNKHPLTDNGLLDATTDLAQIGEWWSRSPDAMIGVRTGAESGVWVLDVDVDEEKGTNGFPALAEFEAVHGPLPMTVRSRTPRSGMHYWFRWMEGVRNSTSKVASGVDVRGRGGYVIVPPSARSDGRSYAWEDPPGLFEIAEAPAWLLEAVTKRPEPEPNCQAGSLVEPSRYAEVALAEECAAVVRAPNGSRNDALNRAAFSLGQLVASGALDESRVRTRLAEAGQGVGLRHDEIARTIDSGLRGGGEHPRAPAQPEVSRRRDEGGRRLPLPDAAPNGKDRTKTAPVVRTAAELRRKVFPDIKWIVPGYLAEGCTLLAGRLKLGKSWLALDIGLAVAAGRYVLGDILCEQGHVLCLALEDNERRLQRRITKVLGAFGQDWPERFTYATEWPRANDGGLDAIRRWIEAAEKPRLVIVDVLAMFKPVRGEKESLYEADYNALKGLQELAGEFGIAILVITHTRKSGSESGDAVETISGTLGLSGAADAFLVLNRDGQGATLAGRGRDVEEVDVAVAFDKAACRWTVQGEASEVRRTDERGAILSALADSAEPMSPTDIALATEMPNLNVRQLLFKMARDGEVAKAGRGLYVLPERETDNKRTPRNNDNKITSLDAYRRERDGDDEGSDDE